MINITEADINLAESILLPDGCVFDDERRSFIKELNTCDVLACPGSGKTTALLAKLLILSKKISLTNGGGVCVLTHTNVAINEIKRRLGAEARTLVSYPNFFGTIQSFIDRFLAIPQFIETYGIRPSIIDTDRWLSALKSTCLKSSARGWIYYRVTRSNAYNSPSDLLGKITLDPETLEFDLSLIGLKDRSKPTHRAISRCCQKVTSSGIVSYENAYTFAEKHIKKHPKLRELIASRYRYVLIDEMQDTDSCQIRLLNTLFSQGGIVTQRVGDPNQAIFSVPKGKDMEWIPREPKYYFSNSMRFGEPLSSAINPVRIDTKIPLSGNPQVDSFSPYILSYDDSCMRSVITAFGRLVQGINWDSIATENRVFKAVGWVGKTNQNACIPLYWPPFQPKTKKRPYFSNLISYIAAYNAQSTCNHNPSLFKEYIMEGLAQLASLSLPHEVIGNVHLTARGFERLLAKDYPKDISLVRNKISLWLHLLISGETIESIHRDMVIFFTTETVFAKHKIDPGKSFLHSKNIDPSCSQGEACNVICYSDYLNIEVGTVHSVKGETHTGTLLLETKYYTKHESEYLISLLTGGKLTKKPGPHLKSCIKVAHVAMSRPTHLFALACHKDRIAKHVEKLKSQGWEIVSVKSLLNDSE